MRETQFNSDVNADKSYLSWIVDLAKRYRTSQIKAATKVNEDMLRFYWSVGEDIEKKQLENLYGSHFYENLSKDLKHELGLKQGLSPSTLKYMRYFYQLYSQLVENRQQDADDFNCIFKIPWTHHMCIIDKVKGDVNKALFFVRKSLGNNWGRGVLLNYLSSDLYERQGAAQTNFSQTLPSSESELAEELLKSPYDFSFLPGKERYLERELKEALIRHITDFLLELGKGFAYVGREYILVAGDKEKKLDLLFYIIPLHRYCVIEVKITEFDFPDIGQLAGYVAMVDDLLNSDGDKPAIGLLICKEKNTVLARYALSNMNQPIGISEYEIARQSIPEELKDALPSTQEIEKRLGSSSCCSIRRKSLNSSRKRGSNTSTI